MRILAADVGATNARFATFRARERGLEKLRERVWPSTEHDGIGSLLRAYLADEERPPERACLALAGPVADGTARLSNLGWVVRREEAAAVAGVPSLRLINDFLAIGHGISLLEERDLVVLQEGDPVPGAPRAILGAGTGLGVAYVDGAARPPRVFPSEGGHAEFAPRDEAERALARFLAERYGRASRERVLSGPGLVDVYRHLASAGFAEERPAVRRELEEGDQGATISRHGLAGDDPLSVRALEMFVSVYGAVAGDLALTLGARGGVVVAGGIAPRILDALRRGPFLASFLAKGRLRDYVAAIPVRVVVNGDVGLLGAAWVATQP